MNPYKYCPHCATLLERRFLEGADRLSCIKCGWINYRNPLPVVSCLVLNKKKELLLIKRGIEPKKGSWALPGGFIELGESVEEAGSRELFEETGLKGKPGRLIGALMQESSMYGTVLVMGMECIVKNFTLSVGDDAIDAKFYPIKKLPFIPFQSQRKLIRTYRRFT